jgi:ATP synthase protein I
MKKHFNRLDKIKIWLLVPLSINLLMGIVVFLVTNFFNAKSAFIGGLVAIIPQAAFGFSSFRYSGAQQSKLIWRSFIKGEAIKFACTGILFALVFIYLLINTMWFLLAFILMQFAGIFVSCRLLNH